MSSISRRDFIKAGAAGMASVSLLSGAQESSEKPFINRKLGKTGITIPVVSMGVMNSLDDALFKASYDRGIRHFDTAANYYRGRNEEMVGKALEEMGVRKDAVVATKIMTPPLRANLSDDEMRDKTVSMAEASLSRLRTGYADILYIHNIDSPAELRNPGILEGLRRIKADGKARFVGFSTHSNMTACILEGIETGSYDVILTSWNYAMIGDEGLRQALEKAAARGIGLVAMKTQCSNLWYKNNLPQDQQKFYGGDLHHKAMLKWALNNAFITTAIPGYTTFQQMEDDVSVARDLNYTDEEKEFFKNRDVKTLAYCVQCRTCVPGCPNRVHIPELMRTYLYAASYANFDQARETLDAIPKRKGLEACKNCTTCVATCRNGVPIKERIEDLINLWG